MAFRRRFAPGTLERSVRRWGRFPRPGFKRKQFSTVYSTLGGAAGTVSTTPALKEVVLFDHEDFAPNAGLAGQIGCRNISVDLSMGLSMLPKAAAYVVEDWYFHWAIIKVDTDQTFASLEDCLAQSICIRWGTQGYVTSCSNSANGAFALWKTPMWRQRFRVSSMKEDEELRFCCSVAFGCSGTCDDLTLLSAARIRYEIP